MTIDSFETLVGDLIQAFRHQRIPLLEDWMKGTFDKSFKEGGSVVTAWDIKLDKLIASVLSQTALPVFSEESLPDNLISFPKEYWLVDPLDGTVEFVEGTADFAINIALIRDSYPVWGLIYQPVTDMCYYTQSNHVVYQGPKGQQEIMPKLSIKATDQNISIALSSRQYKHWQQKKIPVDKDCIKLIGSSLKYIAVGRGEAEIYPRGGVCGEWDTAAGQIIVETLGGVVLDLKSRQRLSYSKCKLMNQGFIVASSAVLAEQFIDKYQHYF